MSRAARAAGLGSSSRSKDSGRSPEDDASLHAGFQNLGNTCFLNSVLQATAATRRLRQLYQPDFDDDDDDDDDDDAGEGTLDDPENIQAQLNALVSGQAQARNAGPRTAGPEPAASSNPAARYAAAAAQIERSRSPALCLADQEHGRRAWSKQRQGLILSRPSSTNGHRPEAAARPAPASDVASAAPEPYIPTSADLPLNTAFRRVLEQSWARSSEAGPSSSLTSKKMQVAPVNPKPLLNQMASKYEQYGEYGQQDGHELLRHLLDSMRMEEMDLIKKLQPPEPKKKRQRRRGVSVDANDARRPLDEGEEALREKYKLAPFVDTLFCGKLLSAVVCEGCRHVSHTYEDFFDISLPVRPELARNAGSKRNRIKSMADRWRRGVAQRPPERVKSAAETRPAFLAADWSDAEYSSAPNGAAALAAAGGIDRPRSAMPDLSGGSGASTPGATGQGPSSADRDKMRFLLKRGTSRARERARAKNTDSEAETTGMPDVGSMTLAPDVTAFADAEGIIARRQEAVGGGLLRAVSRHSRSRKTSAEASTPKDSDAAGAVSSAEQRGETVIPDRAGATTPAALAGRKKSQAYIAQLFAEQPQEAAQPSLFPWMWRGPGTPQQQQWQQQQQPPATTAGGVEAAAAAWVAAAAARRPHLHHLQGGGASPHHHHHGGHHPSSRDEAVRSEILSNQAGTGLIKSLEAFTAVEALDGDNAFACKRCWRRENPLTPSELAAHRRRRTKRGEDIEDSEHSSDDEDSEEEEEGSSALSASLETATSFSSAAGDLAEIKAEGADEGKATVEGKDAPESAARSSTIPIIQTTSADTPTGSAITIAGGAAGQTTLRAPKPIAPGSLKRLHAFAGGDSSSDDEESSASTGEETDLTGSRRDSGPGPPGTAATDSGLSDAAESTSGSPAKRKTSFVDVPSPAKRLGAPGTASSLDEPRRKRSVQSLPRRALKRYLIASLPPVLVVHLKRFEMVSKGFGGLVSSSSSSSKKIDDFVSFPEYLDVGPWLAPPREDWDARGRLKESSDPRALERERRQAVEEAEGKAALVAGEEKHHHHHHHRWGWRGRSRSNDRRGKKEQGDEAQKPRTTYRLYAVIVHQGNMSSGHYTAYVLSDRCGPSIKDVLEGSSSKAQAMAVAAAAAATPKSSSTASHSLEAPGTPFGGSPMLKMHSVPSANGHAPSSAPLAVTAPSEPASSENGDALVPSGASSSASPSNALGVGSGGGGGGGASLKGTISNSSLGSSVASANVATSSVAPSNGTTESEPRASVESESKPRSLGGALSSSAAASPSITATSLPKSTAAASTTTSGSSNDVRRWVFASDTAVRPATIEEVLKSKAYMLFYEQMQGGTA